MILIIRILRFLYLKNIIERLNEKLKFALMYCYENYLTYPVHILKRFEYCMDLLLINDENRLHYVSTKDFKKFMFNKTKHKNKKHFGSYCLQCFHSKRVLVEHKETCLEINCKQTVK